MRRAAAALRRAAVAMRVTVVGMRRAVVEMRQSFSSLRLAFVDLRRAFSSIRSPSVARGRLLQQRTVAAQPLASTERKVWKSGASGRRRLPGLEGAPDRGLPRAGCWLRRAGGVRATAARWFRSLSKLPNGRPNCAPPQVPHSREDGAAGRLWGTGFRGSA